jgi:hypothetical protein
VKVRLILTPSRTHILAASVTMKRAKYVDSFQSPFFLMHFLSKSSRTKSKAEVMAELIAKSKEHKATKLVSHTEYDL